MFCCCYEEDSELLCVKEIDALYTLKVIVRKITYLTNTGGGSPCQNLTFLKNISLVSLPKSNLTISSIINNKFYTVSCYDSITSSREYKELGQHI